ncbi:MAG: serine hydrolase domain-containing protein [Bacteroidota bacterium]
MLPTRLLFGIACLFSVFINAQNTNYQVLDTELIEISKLGLLRGFGVAVVTKDSTLFAKGYGFADVQHKIPYTENSIQNIGSVSKTLIGIALLKAQELGKLTLDDPINAHLDFEVINPYHPQETIRIRHLATHTGTILDTDLYDQKAYYVLNEEDLKLPVIKSIGESLQTLTTKVSMQAFLRNFLSAKGIWYKKKNFLKKKPGVKYEYSNVGATLAAYVLEKATGISYDEFTRKYILEPLEMQASGWSFDGVDNSKHSKLYTDKGEVIPPYSLVTYPDGGLLTDLHDFVLYLQELMKGHVGEGTLLKLASYEALFTKQLPAKKMPKDPNRYNDEFNAGIFMGFSPAGWIGHTGGDPGISTFMFFDPENGLGHIVMLNTSLSGDSINQQLIPIFKAVNKALEE